MTRRMPVMAVCVGMLCGARAQADEWVPVGPTALGQGGAGVAAANGPGSVYWNPALPGLGESEVIDFGTFGLGLDVVAGVAAEGDILKEGDEVFDFVKGNDFASSQARLDAGTATVADVQNAVRLINLIKDMDRDGQGLYSASGATAELRLGWLTFFAHDRLYAGADPVVDFSLGGASSLSAAGIAALFDTDGGGPDTGPLVETAVAPPAVAIPLRDALVTAGFTTNQANALAAEANTAIGADVAHPGVVSAVQSVGAATVAGGAGLGANQSGFDVKALNLQEVGVAVSIPVVPKTLAVGVALKEIFAETSWVRVNAIANEGSDYGDEVKDGIDKNRKASSSPSMDLGVAYSPVETLRLGLTGKDIFGAEFDLKNRSEDIEIDPQVRFGASWHPIGFFSVAADADVVENESDLLDGYESRLVGGGVGFHIPILGVLRAGAMKNVASSEAEPTYTAGWDLFIWKFKLGVAGAYAPSDVEIETSSGGGSKEEIPQRVGLAASFGFGVEW